MKASQPKAPPDLSFVRRNSRTSHSPRRPAGHQNFTCDFLLVTVAWARGMSCGIGCSSAHWLILPFFRQKYRYYDEAYLLVVVV